MTTARAATPIGSDVTVPPSRHGELTVRSAWKFFAATFGVSWGLGVLVVSFMDQIESVFGPLGYTNPAFILMVYSPGFIGVYMVWRHYGMLGLRLFFRRFTLARMSAAWWLTLLLGVPAIFYSGALITGNVGNFPFDHWYEVLPALIPAFLIGPIEELGWRGVALPLLQRRLAPLYSALILGTISAVWHTPAFFMAGTKQAAWSFWPFFFGVVAISVILTPMFNAAGGSLLIAVLFHAQMNGPAWPDAQPWDMVGFVLVAVVVAFVNRKAMLDRRRGSTAVLAPALSQSSVPPGRSPLRDAASPDLDAAAGAAREDGGLPRR